MGDGGTGKAWLCCAQHRLAQTNITGTDMRYPIVGLWAFPSRRQQKSSSSPCGAGGEKLGCPIKLVPSSKRLCSHASPPPQKAPAPEPWVEGVYE